MAKRGSSGPFDWLRGFGTRASLLLLLLVSLALLVVSRTSEGEMPFKGLRRVVDDIAKPPMQLIEWPLSGIQKLNERIAAHWNASQRVLELERENRTLRQWESLSHALHAKILRYEKLLNIQGEDQIRVLSTRLISESRGPFVRSALLRAGSSSGVAEGQAVVDPDGMVGRIVTVGKYSSRVLMLTDLNSRVPVTFEGNTSRAILAGDNAKHPKLIYINNGFVPAISTRVLTSGDDGILPSGLMIGKVVEIDEQHNVRVQLFANLNSVDYVQVLTRPLVIPPEQEPVESPAASEVSVHGDHLLQGLSQ